MKKKSLKYSAIGFLFGASAIGSVFGIVPDLLLFGIDVLIWCILIVGIFGAFIGFLIGHRVDVRSDLLNKNNAIRSALKSVLADPKKTIESKRLIKEWLNEKGLSREKTSKKSVDAIFSFASDYVQRTPDLIEAVIQAYKWSNLEQEIVFLLRKTALSYFENKEDLVSDSSGIARFLKDAYLAQYLIEKVTMLHGGKLASVIERSVDLHDGNESAAALLPAKVHEALKSKVDAALKALQVRQMLIRMAQQSNAVQRNWNPSSGGIDFKREIVRDEIRHGLAKDGIFL